MMFIETKNPILWTSASEVSSSDILSEKTQAIIDQMLDIAGGNRKDLKQAVMVGLAAPQIGINKRIILVDIGIDNEKRQFGELKAFINPKIVWASPKQILGREGCYSVDSRLCGIVSRAESIKFIAYDRQGNLLQEEVTGLTAVIFQHEIDHLDGFCFPDRVGEKGALHWVESNEFPEYRKNWQHWARKCPWNTWLAMKEGKNWETPNLNASQ